METRRLLLAVLLSFAVLMIWSYFFPPQKTQAPPPPAAEEGSADLGPAPGPVPEAGGAGRPSIQPGQPDPRLPAVPEVFADSEQRVTLETERLRAVFSNLGGQLVSMETRPPQARPGQQGIELVRKRAGELYPFSLTDPELRPHPANEALFKVTPGDGGRSLLFQYRGPRGVVEKRFRFDERGLLRAEIRVPGQAGWGVLLGPGIRNPTAEELGSQYATRGAVYKGGDDAQVLEAGDLEAERTVPGRGLRWVGLEDTYFLSALIPETGVAQAVFQPLLVDPTGEAPRFVPLPAEDQLTDEQKDLSREVRVVVQSAGDRMALVSYWGAKEYDRLAALPYGLQETVAFGSLKFLALPLLAVLNWIHDNMVANYGWAIVLLTLALRILLLPLTHQSTVSMKKMQKLNPKINAIRDRYKGKLRDKQGRPNLEVQRKMNEEVMGLYKSEGVNPAGGCLPLLLQMPILFAIYRLLITAAELQGAPWILWVQDLSAKDPYYVLPIVMGLTQFLQVLFSPQVGDPVQRRMFLFLPLFMTVFFLGVPSGLALYWFTNSVLTILQQGVYNRLQKE